MTRDEIKKALRTCSVDSCTDCPYDNKGLYCCGKLKRDALDLITEQEEENEKLRAKNEQLEEDIDMIIKEQKSDYKFDIIQAKIDVLTELKTRHDYAIKNMGYPWDISQQIDELIKEIEK